MCPSRLVLPTAPVHLRRPGAVIANSHDGGRSEEPELGPDGLPAFFGAFRAGRSDASERVEEILAEGYGREA